MEIAVDYFSFFGAGAVLAILSELRTRTELNAVMRGAHSAQRSGTYVLLLLQYVHERSAMVLVRDVRQIYRVSLIPLVIIVQCRQILWGFTRRLGADVLHCLGDCYFKVSFY